MKQNAMTLKSIGHIRAQDGNIFLELESGYIPALKELDGFSHVQVLWWASQCDTEEARTLVECEQPYKQAPEKIGVFATRSPARPNPIALTPVAIIQIDHVQGKIVIPFIDAEDGTPILDLKPYHPAIDRIREVKVPQWCAHWPQWYEDSASFDWADEFVNAQ